MLAIALSQDVWCVAPLVFVANINTLINQVLANFGLSFSYAIVKRCATISVAQIDVCPVLV